MLRKNAGNLELEEKEVLDLLFDASPLMRKAYQLREKLRRIFDNEKHTKESSRRAIRRWMAQVRESGLDCFDKFLGTSENTWTSSLTTLPTVHRADGSKD